MAFLSTKKLGGEAALVQAQPRATQDHPPIGTEQEGQWNPPDFAKMGCLGGSVLLLASIPILLLLLLGLLAEVEEEEVGWATPGSSIHSMASTK
jgi:hypothetical protein